MWFLCLSVCLSVCHFGSFCLSFCLCVCLSDLLGLSACLSVWCVVRESVCLPACLSVCVVCLSICACVNAGGREVCMSVCVCTHMTAKPFRQRQNPLLTVAVLQCSLRHLMCALRCACVRGQGAVVPRHRAGVPPDAGVGVADPRAVASVRDQPHRGGGALFVVAGDGLLPPASFALLLL